MTQAQFKRIRPFLERARKKTRPRTHDLYDVFNGVFYLVRAGCPWRMIPKEYPPWKSLHAYFRIWSEIPEGKNENILALVLKKLAKDHRAADGRKSKTSFIPDSAVAESSSRAPQMELRDPEAPRRDGSSEGLRPGLPWEVVPLRGTTSHRQGRKFRTFLFGTFPIQSLFKCGIWVHHR
ncbi:MAG: transposase [Elusimicrobia bacterium]|nr:transposase [Elusimicrobiota bacterium]